MALPEEQRRQMARALWSYTGMKQPAFATAAGIEYNRFRASLNDKAKDPPTTDELLAMTRVADVPEALAVSGWSAADPVQHLGRRLDELNGEVRRLERELEAAEDRFQQAMGRMYARVSQELGQGLRTGSLPAAESHDATETHAATS